jgi:ubiquinol-cytochrome c reductase iron-sulfur subunit
MAETANPGADPGHSGDGETRRDFLYLTAAAMGLAGTAAVAWPIIDSMNPAADVRALASTEVDLSPIEEGMAITVLWRGNPVFVRHRTAAEIETARGVPLDVLPDPETDEARVKKPQWLIMVGVCTHLGCIPKGQRVGETKGEYDGWFCPCHGSHYDTSGRIRKGPAPSNLPVPPYQFLDDTTIEIG